MLSVAVDVPKEIIGGRSSLVVSNNASNVPICVAKPISSDPTAGFNISTIFPHCKPKQMVKNVRDGTAGVREIQTFYSRNFQKTTKHRKFNGYLLVPAPPFLFFFTLGFPSVVIKDTCWIPNVDNATAA